MLDTTSSVLLGIDIVLVLLIWAIFFVNYSRHRRQIQDAYSQTIILRLAFVFVITSILFFLDFIWQIVGVSPTVGEVQESVGHFISGIIEGFVLKAFFTLLIVQVGGTERAIQIFSVFPKNTDEAAAKALYHRFRKTLYLFAILRPFLAVALTLLSTDSSPSKGIRVVLAVINMLLLGAAVLALIKTLIRLKEHIPAKFHVHWKFIVVKLVLLVAAMQWTIYSYIDSNATEESHLKVYWSVSLLEVFALSLAFYAVSSPSSFQAMATPSPNFWRMWDVFEDPIAEYKSLEDNLSTDFTRGPSSPPKEHYSL